MPLLSLARFFAAIVSAIILVAAGYLLWSWYEGAWIRDSTGDLVRLRDDWRLWTGAALLTWSFLGGSIFPLLLAKGGGRPSEAKHGSGATIDGASGSSLYVEELGPPEAPILLFTHGWGMDSTFWDYARKDLSGRFRLVVWDLPGLGRSQPPPGGAISLANFAADLRELSERFDRPVVLIGHSIGGMTIQTLARDHPEAMNRVAGVVLLNTTFTNPLKTMVFARVLTALQKPLLEPATHLTIWLSPLVWLSKWQSYLSGSTHAAMRIGFGKFVTRSQLRHAALLATRASPAIEGKGDLAMFRWDAAGALARSETPVLVIGGDLDLVTKLEASQDIASEAPGAQLRVVSGVNHMGPMERADLYNDAIAEFALGLGPKAQRLRDEEPSPVVAEPSIGNVGDARQASSPAAPARSVAAEIVAALPADVAVEVVELGLNPHHVAGGHAAAALVQLVAADLTKRIQRPFGLPAG